MKLRTIIRSAAASTALVAFGLPASILPAGAQEAVVSGCSGVSLPRSAVTQIMRPVVEGVAAPLEDGINGLLGSLPGTVDTNAAGLLDDAASGQPITLSALTTAGTLVGPDDRCLATSDAVTLDEEAGIAIGGNRISGLGADGAAASAGEIGSIALGNDAATAAGATNALALGTGATASAANSVALGAGSTTQANLAAGAFRPGNAAVAGSLAAGEVSVGGAGAERRVTNLAAGAAATDAVNLSQLQAVNDRVTAVDNRVTNLGNSVTAINGTVNVLNTTVTNVDGRVTAIDNRVTTVEGDVSVLTNRVSNVEADVTVLGNRVTTVERLGLRYDGPDKTRVTLAGAGGTTITNLGAGTLSSTSTDAVNGSQLHATNQALLELSRTAVQYDVDASGNPTNTVTMRGGNSSQPVRVRNVARGTAATDAANVEQLQEVETNTKTYTDNRIASLNANYDRVNARVDDVEDQARSAAAIGLAAASVRFDDTPGKLSAGIGGGVWRGQGAFAAGVGYTNETGKVRVNATATVADGEVGGGAGLSFTFN